MKHTRRILTLLLSAVAFSALVGPALAQASGPTWQIGGDDIGEGVSLNGSLKWEFGTSGIQTGPCGVDLAGSNERIEAGSFAEGSCSSTFPGCSVTPELTQASLPWNVSSTGTETSIEDVKIVLHWTKKEACPPGDWVMTGTLNGYMNSSSGCLEYEKASGLKLQSGTPMATSGALCVSGTSVEAAGELSLNIGGLQIGPCEPGFQGTVSNFGGSAIGHITGGALLQLPCSTNLPGCVVEGMTPQVGKGISALEDSSLVLSDLFFTVTPSSGCAKYGFWKPVTVAGTVTSYPFDIEPEAECAFYENTEGLLAEGVTKVQVNGELCLMTEGGGEAITLG